MSSLKISLRIDQQGLDSLAMKGFIDVPADFAPDGKHMDFDIGGVTKSLVLDAKGAGSSGDDVVKLKIKVPGGIVAAQSASFKMSMKRESVAEILEPEGLINADVTESTASITAFVRLDGAVYQSFVPQIYKAKACKSGKTK